MSLDSLKHDKKDLLDYSQKNALNRVIRCLFAEKLLDIDNASLEKNSPKVTLRLNNKNDSLKFNNLLIMSGKTCINKSTVIFCSGNKEEKKLNTASELLNQLYQSKSLMTDTTGLNETLIDIENSIRNDYQARSHHHNWNIELAKKAKNHQSNSFFHFCKKFLTSRQSNILLDQWGSINGHPFYPTWKTKPNLSEEEVMEISPEFNKTVAIRIASLKKNMAYIENMENEEYTTFFKINFHESYTAWIDLIESKNQDPKDWLPIPIHSWHLKHHISTMYKRNIDAGDLILEGPNLMARPTMSFRTLLPETPQSAPFIKLPVALWLTSELRGLQAKSIHMGPRFSTIMSQIIKDEKGFGNTLEILPENTGLHFRDAQRKDDDEGKLLSVIFRSSSALDRLDGLLPITVAALLTDSPVTHKPLLIEIFETLHSKNDSKDITHFFRDYAKTVLTPVLSMYLLYGLTLEAHQQNASILFDKKGTPHRMLIKDFGDARAFAPLLEARGYSIEPYRYKKILPTVFHDDITPIRSFIIDACFICHLHEIILLLTQYYSLDESLLCHTLREVVISLFSDLKPRIHDAEFWQTERDALLEDPWPTRSVLRMHLANYADYRIQHNFPNPLATKR